MAAVVHGVDFNDTLNTSATRVTGSFTPAANDLLVCFVCHDGTSTLPSSVTDSQGGSWTLVKQGQKSSLDVTAVYVRNTAVAASSMTVTVTPGAAGTGMCISVERVSGMSLYGSSAIKQSANVNNTGSGTTPFVTFGANVLTGNPTIVCLMHGDVAPAVTPPTNWTERADIGHANPTRSMETASRDSGFTGLTVTWGAAVTTAWGSLGVELDTSAATNVTGSGSPSTSLSSSASGTGTETFSGSGSPSTSLSSSASGTGTETFSGSGTPSISLSVSASGTGVLTITGSGSPSTSLSASVSATGQVDNPPTNVDGSGSPSVTLSVSASGTGVLTITGSGSPSKSLGASASGTGVLTITGSGSPSKSLSATVTATGTHIQNVTGSGSPSKSLSATVTATAVFGDGQSRRASGYRRILYDPAGAQEEIDARPDWSPDDIPEAAPLPGLEPLPERREEATPPVRLPRKQQMEATVEIVDDEDEIDFILNIVLDLD